MRPPRELFPLIVWLSSRSASPLFRRDEKHRVRRSNITSRTNKLDSPLLPTVTGRGSFFARKKRFYSKRLLLLLLALAMAAPTHLQSG